LRQRAEEWRIAPQIRWLGWQKDVEIVYDAADIFCQPNVGPEPFGLTFVEALWRGKPVVTTGMAGALEVVSPDCGILTPPGDVGAVAGALRELIEAPSTRQSLGQAGPGRARYLCDPAARLLQIHELLKELTGAS
jgi:glycosyltransferase involved in cell wall biosynthesis